MKDLGKFEGKTELSARMNIAGVNDRLKTPLSALPRAWESGERVPVLLYVDVGKIRHDPVTGGWERMHLTDVHEAFVLDHVAKETLDEMVADQREGVVAWELEQKRLKAEAKGEFELDLDGDEAEGDGTGEALPPISDSDWEASARAQGVSAIGSKQAKKAKG